MVVLPQIVIFFVFFCFIPNPANHLKTSPNSSFSVKSLKCVTITLSQKKKKKASLFLLYSHCHHTHNTSDTRHVAFSPYYAILCFPGSSVSKESSCNAGDAGSIPGLGRSPGEGNSYPLQYSSLKNSMYRGAWQATVHRVSKSWRWPSGFHFHKQLSAISVGCSPIIRFSDNTNWS